MVRTAVGLRAGLPTPRDRGGLELAEHRFLFINQGEGSPGGALHTVFVDDLDTLVAGIRSRGLEPDERETYSNGVRKAIYRDADGNEIGFGGPPQSA